MSENRGADFIHIKTTEDPDHDVPVAPIVVEGVTYLPAGEWSFISLTDERDDSMTHGMMIMRMAGASRMGLNMAMSPATLRHTAKRMAAVADQIEKHARAKADAVFARAAGKSRT
ncbi:hypothetical protein FIM10_01925 [Sphingomonadales bacterium 56]|uniref:hypothetical protein n=1 Tax=unclassified Sphingobium TaxID=2611147 RepID=UPI001919C4D1|nr:MULTISPECIES: hypothetical protein [unclassified Sphingobium]MBY2927442.1 hypothetical protein [Sphingomonadales bacterium 56]MBY2957510.1 hypothetical protein [Sphingomonadales bacterium 58]MBY2957553.1 hypothetical protein [Sphingomonadales bacterium 58]CAD7335203.1 hypothetical protein SPHS8_00389 [Sphingobium sp. S8]CAD7335222.1 hypothetical protein SPHS6_00389 [Sphingobium sp. S6]